MADQFVLKGVNELRDYTYTGGFQTLSQLRMTLAVVINLADPKSGGIERATIHNMLAALFLILLALTMSW